MNIKSLLNKDSVTITNCDAEPIHIPGSIQPCGFLLGVQQEQHTITYCSENCAQYLGQPLSHILGQPLASFFKETEIAGFKIYYASENKELSQPFVFTLGDKSYNTSAHLSGQCIVLEFEPFVDDPHPLPNIYIQTRRFAYHTQRADNLVTFCRDIADETRQIIGYDRVMVYRFDADYNGEVIAESRREDLPPYLGLHYPHTDIPVQARALYLRNLVRMIPDINYTPVPLFALEEEGRPVETLDLTMSLLRSVSVMHVHYLKNMGVSATFVISLIHNDKLWGMIACHHQTPKYIPYYTRLAAHLQGIFLSSQIDVREVADAFDVVKKTDQKLQLMEEGFATRKSNIYQPAVLLQLRELLNADGLVLLDKDAHFIDGKVPSREHIRQLTDWLFEHVAGTHFHTSRLIDHYPGAESISEHAAGLCFLALDHKARTGIIWLRSEVQKTIEWAGDPNKAVSVDEVSRAVQPRQSFESWKELVRYQSADWHKAELNAASVICASLQRHMHLADLLQEESKYRTLNGRLKKANDELANMNWISTHDLKEPLRKIQMYASVVLEKQGDQIPDTVRSNINRMQVSAARMQLLIDDLLAYTKVVNEEKKFAPIDLNLLMPELHHELAEEIQEKVAVVHWPNALPLIMGVPFQIRQVLINLISNGLKFSAPGVAPVIRVGCEEVDDSTIAGITEKQGKRYHQLTVSDNGIGFNPEYRENILKIFQRLHSHQYPGTGVGLAICKKIAEAHNGFLEADGEEGKGATFSFYLPVAPVLVPTPTPGEQTENNFTEQ